MISKFGSPKNCIKRFQLFYYIKSYAHFMRKRKGLLREKRSESDGDESESEDLSE